MTQFIDEFLGVYRSLRLPVMASGRNGERVAIFDNDLLRVYSLAPNHQVYVEQYVNFGQIFIKIHDALERIDFHRSIFQ